MKRREFITLLGGAAVTWPQRARAQQLPVVGFISSAGSDESTHLIAAFRQGLGGQGYIEGRNVTIQFHWANGALDQLPRLAAELVRRQVNVIVAAGGFVVARAAKAATPSIPIVFTIGGDPVALGLVAALNRPGGNITGVSALAQALGPKRLEVLRELAPKAAVVAMLTNPNAGDPAGEIKLIRDAARTIGLPIVIAHASNDHELDDAFAGFSRNGVGALLVSNDAFYNNRRERLVELAVRHAIPAVYDRREFVVAGGLASYASVFADNYRQIGDYVGRILKGAKPGELPVVQPTKFELVVNLKAAKAIGLAIPELFLVRADEVIE
jgi:putative ABC transport system substrate-binding protein